MIFHPFLKFLARKYYVAVTKKETTDKEQTKLIASRSSRPQG
jgi:hypothetical protein